MDLTGSCDSSDKYALTVVIDVVIIVVDLIFPSAQYAPSMIRGYQAEAVIRFHEE